MAMVENLELTKRVAAMTAEACTDLFRAYGVELEPMRGGFGTDDERMLCGVIGFVGSGVRGSCMLAGHDSPIMSSCPEGDRVRDWIGELANQLAGRIKAKFLLHRIEVGLSTPIGLSGVALQPLPRNELRPACFAAKGGTVLVWVEVDADPTFTFSEQTIEPGRTEGEIVIF
jgi:hypothetical protein